MKQEHKLNNVLVKDGGLVNHLLNNGFSMSNVTKNRYCASGTIFYFRPQTGIYEAIEKYKKDHNWITPSSPEHNTKV